MAEMFSSLADVGAHVRRNTSGHGKAMLQLQLAMGDGYFGERSRTLIEQWLREDDARLAAEEKRRREEWEHQLQTRTLLAAETQAREAMKTTWIAWAALGVSVVGIVISLAALLKP
jgi:hypothetical protein